MVATLHGVAPETVSGVTRTYIRPENMTLTMVGDQGKIERQLERNPENPLKQ